MDRNFCLLGQNACPRGQGMLYAELPPRTLVRFNATNAIRKNAVFKHVKCASTFKCIAMNDFACPYHSCDCDIHALLYRL